LNANVAAGKAVNNPSVPVTFPTDSSSQSQAARVEAALVTLQNLHGPGQGCPASSTTLSAQLTAAQNGQAAPAPAPAPAAPAPAAPAPAAPAPANNAAAAPAASSGTASAAQVAQLAPNLGFTAGRNPDGTGNCDGINGPNGQPIKIPCACPPSQADFVTALQANVAAGKAVNNPSVPFSFPTDSSSQSQAARIEAGLVTLQNLHGPGQGCPASSSTLSVSFD
jgi:Fe-S cluster biogenesis protein NfuA